MIKMETMGLGRRSGRNTDNGDVLTIIANFQRLQNAW